MRLLHNSQILWPGGKGLKITVNFIFLMKQTSSICPVWEAAQPQLRWRAGGERRCPGVPVGCVAGGPGAGLPAGLALATSPAALRPHRVPPPRAGAQPIFAECPWITSQKCQRNLGSPKFKSQKFIPREEKLEQHSEASNQEFKTSWNSETVNLTAACHLLLVWFTLNFSV